MTTSEIHPDQMTFDDLDGPLVFIVAGVPAPQGSKRFVGKGIMVESSKAVKPWREDVRQAALTALAGRLPMEGPLMVRLDFTLRKPTSAPKRRRTWPSTRPDVDKLARATLDALGSAGVYHDDAQVIHLVATKLYPDEGEHALPVPGVHVEVRRVTE